MKKNYSAPQTVVITVAAAQMICGSNSMTISNTSTSSQWSREGDSDWDEE